MRRKSILTHDPSHSRHCKEVNSIENLKKIPTEQLVAELLDRGCLKVSTQTRMPYQRGYKLIQTGYGLDAEIKAQTVLVVPPFHYEQ